MSEETMKDTSATGRMKGCVKWFNNKQGFGFINVTSGDNVGTDLFVHHSAIQVDKEQYKYLVQGEYVEFELCKADQATHKWQAGNVRGLDNGRLMCETRHETRLARPTSPHAERGSSEQPDGDRRVRVRGTGPREGRDTEEWFLIKRRVGNTSNRDNGGSRDTRGVNVRM
tara:strand:+ start:217 stop:726 length:510 start_codon:yes stop_codon:yes gene_type:complete